MNPSANDVIWFGIALLVGVASFVLGYTSRAIETSPSRRVKP